MHRVTVPSSCRNVIAVILAAALLGIMVALGPSKSAWAHAAYDRSTPGTSESVATSPTTVDIYTKQDMRRQAGQNEIKVSDEAGSQVDDGNTVIDDDDRRHFSVGLQPNLPAGRYTVQWHNFSDEDDEAFGSAFAFYLGVQPTTQQLEQDRELQEQAELVYEEGDASPAATSSGTSVQPTDAPTSAPSPTTSAPTDDTTDGGSNTGIIVGVIIAAIVVVAIGGGALAYSRMRKE